jgi:hypothetical protein
MAVLKPTKIDNATVAGYPIGPVVALIGKRV